jgi:hypothetical protein
VSTSFVYLTQSDEFLSFTPTPKASPGALFNISIFAILVLASMCRNETVEPVPVVPIDNPVIINAQARVEAYRQSLNEYLALSDAIMGAVCEEDTFLQVLEKFEPLYQKQQEFYMLRRVACESHATTEEKDEWELEEKRLAEKISEWRETLVKERAIEEKRQSREDWYIGQQQTLGIIPIKHQITYWAISAFAVTTHQMYVGGLNTSCAYWTSIMVAVMTVTGRGGWATRSTWQSTTLLSAGVSGQAVQAFILLRPLRHLMAWLADGVVSLISATYPRLWRRIRDEKTQAIALV